MKRKAEEQTWSKIIKKILKMGTLYSLWYCSACFLLFRTKTRKSGPIPLQQNTCDSALLRKKYSKATHFDIGNKLHKLVRSGSLSNQIAKMSYFKPKYRGMPYFYFSKELHICPPLFFSWNRNRVHVQRVKVKSITRPIKNIDLQGVPLKFRL